MSKDRIRPSITKKKITDTKKVKDNNELSFDRGPWDKVDTQTKIDNVDKDDKFHEISSKLNSSDNLRKRKKLEKTKSPTDKDIELDTSIPLSKIKRNLQINFFLSLILGIAIILIFPDKLYGFLPLGAMLIYIAIGIKSLKSANAKPIFADSIYYLGFLFTFVSLLVAIMGSNQVQEIITQMGTALSTTIFGMAVRILISHFDPIETNVDDAVVDEMSNMAKQVRILTTELTSSIENQLKSIKEISTASSQQLDAMNKTLETISDLNNRDSSITDFNDKFNKLNIGFETFIDETKKASEMVSKFGLSTAAISSTLATSSKIVENTKNTSLRLDELNTKLKDVVEEAVTDKENLTVAVNEIKKQIDDAKKTITKTSNLSLELEERIEQRLSNILKLIRDR